MPGASMHRPLNKRVRTCLDKTATLAFNLFLRKIRISRSTKRMRMRTSASPESVCDQAGSPVGGLFQFIGKHAGNTAKQRAGAVSRRDEGSQRAAVEPGATSPPGRPNVNTAGRVRQQRENRNIQPLRHAKARPQKAANRTIFGSTRRASRIRRLAWCSHHHDASTHLFRRGAISRRSRGRQDAREFPRPAPSVATARRDRR